MQLGAAWMRDRLRIAMLSSLVCISSSTLAAVENYVGLSYKYRTMHGRDNSTYNYDTRYVLPNFYSGAELVAAHRFDTDVGIQIGYEQSQNTLDEHTFSAGQQFLGPPQNAGDISVTHTTIKALQLNMVGYLGFAKNLEAIGQFGISIMHADMNGTITSAGITNNLAPSKTYKVIPTVGIGLQYFILGSKIGLKVLGDWEATNLYRLHMTDDDGVRYAIRPFKQSWCFTVGVVYRF